MNNHSQLRLGLAAVVACLVVVGCDYEGLDASKFASEADIADAEHDDGKLSDGDQTALDGVTQSDVEQGDGDQGEVDAAEEVSGTVDAGTCSDASQCDDGDACTKDDCKAGSCVHDKIDCADAHACTVDTCDAAKGCQNTPNDALCDDKIPCIANTCTAQSGCSNKTQNDKCDDGHACTKDVCVPLKGCQYTTDALKCDDGHACTEDDCKEGEGCTYETNNSVCDDGQPCSIDLCKLPDGCTVTLDHKVCGDGTDCTKDVCVVKTGCTYTPDNSACKDAHDCTTDTCDALKDCQHAVNHKLCADKHDCTVDTCDDKTGCKNAADAKECNDGNSCTVDACDKDKGCTAKAMSGLACDDGDLCTDNDICEAGKCKTGKPKVCDDSKDCTVDTCDAKTGKCANKVDLKAKCDDGKACTGPDKCTSAGACAGAQTVCEDGDNCTSDTCDGKTGDCSYTAVPKCASPCPYYDRFYVSKFQHPEYSYSNDFLYDVAVAEKGGGSIAVGHVIGGPSVDGLAIRRADDGKLVWVRLHGGAKVDKFTGVLATSDGGAWAVGHTMSKGAGNSDGWVVSMDSNGKSKAEITAGGKGADVFTAIAAGTGGKILVAGQKTMPSNDKQAWIAWLNSQGKLMVSTEMHIGAPLETEIFNAIAVQLQTGALTAVGTSTVLGKSSQGYIAMLPAGGGLKKKLVGGADTDRLYAVAMVKDKILAVGSTVSPGKKDSDGWLLVTDATLKDPDELVAVEDGNDEFRDLIVTDEGIVALVGKKDGKDGWLLGVDAVNNKVLGGQVIGGDKVDALYAMEQTADGGLLAVGHSYSKAKYVAAWSIRRDKFGQGCCSDNGDCNDGDDCSVDKCDFGKGICTASPSPPGASCDDGSVCTSDDKCGAGGCSGKAKDCDDGDGCTTDSCDAGTGKCQHSDIKGCEKCAYSDQLTFHLGTLKPEFPSSNEKLFGVTSLGGGSVAAGNVVGGSNKADSDGLLVRRDATGKLLWGTTYGGNFNDNLNDVVARSDGGVWSVGFKGGPGFYNAWVVYAGGDGTKKEEFTFGAQGTNYLAAAWPMADDGVFAVGHAADGGKMNALLVQLDKSGKGALFNGKSSLALASASQQHLLGLHHDAGKNTFYAVGYSDLGGGKSIQGMISRIQANGAVQTDTHGTYKDQRWYDVLQLDGGDLVAVGYAFVDLSKGTQGWVARLDPNNLTVKSQQLYGGAGSDEFSAVLPSSGNSVATFGVTHEKGNRDGVGVIFDLDQGAVTNKRLWGGSGKDNIDAAAGTAAGDLLLAGTSNSYGKVGNSDGWQLHLDGAGLGCCKQKSDCDDGDPCTQDACGASGKCSHDTTADGVSCGADKACKKGKCIAVVEKSPPSSVVGTVSPALVKTGTKVSINVSVTDTDTDHDKNIDDIAHVVVDAASLDKTLGKVTLLPKGKGVGKHASLFASQNPLPTANLAAGAYPLIITATDKSGQAAFGVVQVYVYSGKIIEVAKAGKPYKAIGTAIAVAGKGDAVRVGAGTWTGGDNMGLGSKGGDVVLISESGAANTIIDCQGGGPAFSYIGTGHTLANVVAGFTIKNCKKAAMRLGELNGKGAATSVSDCKFTNNSNPSPGGAIDVDGAKAHLRVARSVFVDNLAEGIAGMGGAVAAINGATIEMFGVELTSNKAGFGGAIATTGSAPAAIALALCTFKENQAGLAGGALSASQKSKWNLSGSQFQANRAIGDGGAIYDNKGGEWEVQSCGFTSNQAADPPGAPTGSGGAIHAKGGTWNFNGSVFAKNEAGSEGGAIHATDGKWAARDTIVRNNKTETGAGGFLWSKGGSWLIERAYIASNTAAAAGGALHVDAPLTGKHVVVAGNKAVSGAGLYLLGSGPHLLQNWLFEGNVASGTGGGLVVATPNATPVISSTTFASNQAKAGGGIALVLGGLKLEHNIVWGNAATTGAQIHVPSGPKNGPMTVSISDVRDLNGDVDDADKDINKGKGITGVNGSIALDPLFVPGPKGNVYLSQTAAGQSKSSPCVDSSTQGVTAAQAKLDQMTTRTDGKPDTGKLDLGYHNFN